MIRVREGQHSIRAHKVLIGMRSVQCTGFFDRKDE